MSYNSPISDFISRVNNALSRKKHSVMVLKSKFIQSILSLLKDEGYIKNFKINDDDNCIHVELKYFNGDSAISSLELISKPGRRVYRSIKNMPVYKDGLGIYVLSTSMGMLTDKQAHQKNVGGEVICKLF